MANKDTDYLYISGRVRSLEGKLLNQERMDRMLDAPTPMDAARVLVECGYPEVEEVTPSSINKMLTEQQQKVFEDLSRDAPDQNIVDAFRIKYDYHNAKALLKAEVLGIDADDLMSHAGRVPVEKMQDAIRTSEFTSIPGRLSQGIREAREVLGNTRDPQQSDTVLDRAWFEDMMAMADESDSDFLRGYVRLNIDAVNLKSLVRVMRMGKDADYLRTVLFPNGNIGEDRISGLLSSGGQMTDLYATSALKEAAEAGSAATQGGSLTQFEKLCDNAIMDYVRKAKYVAFGEATLVAYLAAKESELVAARIILTGRLAGLSADTIRERLRESYV